MLLSQKCTEQHISKRFRVWWKFTQRRMNFFHWRPCTTSHSISFAVLLTIMPQKINLFLLVVYVHCVLYTEQWQSPRYLIQITFQGWYNTLSCVIKELRGNYKMSWYYVTVVSRDKSWGLLLSYFVSHKLFRVWHYCMFLTDYAKLISFRKVVNMWQNLL
jgi:hypothetical protein